MLCQVRAGLAGGKGKDGGEEYIRGTHAGKAHY